METKMRNKIARVLLFSALMLIFVAQAATAKDLTQRLGVGYNHVLGFDTPDVGGLSLGGTSNDSLSVKYWITQQFGVEGLLGLTYAKYEDDKVFGTTIGGRFHANLIYEQNMNVYAGAGLGLIPVSTDVNGDADNNVGFMMQGFGGFEFFLPGLPNLALNTEIGLQYVDYDEFQGFGTFGAGFGVVGIRYYF